MFDIHLLRDDPSIFYSFAKEIYPPNNVGVSPTHAFLKLLQDKNKLCTVYTQNIDGLELRAGVKKENLVQCHGSFATATCMKCNAKYTGDEIRDDIISGKVPYCQKCPPSSSDKQKNSRKRKFWSENNNDSNDDEQDDEEDNPGVIKPDVTFFGEPLPSEFADRLLGGDAEKCDLVICIGTSLKVAPVSELIGIIPPSVPQLYISKNPVHHIQFDVDMLGPCDQIIENLCRNCEWDLSYENAQGEVIHSNPSSGNADWEQVGASTHRLKEGKSSCLD